MLIKSHEQLNQAVCETFFPRNCQRWDFVKFFLSFFQVILNSRYFIYILATKKRSRRNDSVFILK